MALPNGDFFLRQARMGRSAAKGGVNQRECAHAPPEHQYDQNALRKQPQLRRDAQGKAHRGHGRSGFKHTHRHGQPLGGGNGKRA